MFGQAHPAVLFWRLSVVHGLWSSYLNRLRHWGRSGRLGPRRAGHSRQHLHSAPHSPHSPHSHAALPPEAGLRYSQHPQRARRLRHTHSALTNTARGRPARRPAAHCAVRSARSARSARSRPAAQYGSVQWRCHGGQAGQLAPPPPTSDQTPREIDADPRRLSRPKKKWGRFTGFVLKFYMHRRYGGRSLVLWLQKEGVLEVVEGVTLVNPR